MATSTMREVSDAEGVNLEERSLSRKTAAFTENVPSGENGGSSPGDVSENEFGVDHGTANGIDDRVELDTLSSRATPPRRFERGNNDDEPSENALSPEDKQQNGKRSNRDEPVDRAGGKQRRFKDGGENLRQATKTAEDRRLKPEMAKTRNSFIAGRSQALGGDSEAQRGRRMFQGLLGTLQKFQVDEEQKHKAVEEKQAEIQKKLEATLQEERNEAMKERRHVGDERRKKASMMRLLQAKAEAIKRYEDVVAHYERYATYIRSDTNPPVYYKPKNLNVALKRSLSKTHSAHTQFLEEQRTLLTKQLKQIDARIAAVNGDGVDDLQTVVRQENSNPPAIATTLIRVVNNDNNDGFEPSAAGISSSSLANRLEMSSRSPTKAIVGNSVDRSRSGDALTDGRGRNNVPLRGTASNNVSQGPALASTVYVAPSPNRQRDTHSPSVSENNSPPHAPEQKVSVQITVNNNRRDQQPPKRRRMSSDNENDNAVKLRQRRRLSTSSSPGRDAASPGAMRGKTFSWSNTDDAFPEKKRPMRVRSRSSASASRSPSSRNHVVRGRALFPVRPANDADGVRQKPLQRPTRSPSTPPRNREIPMKAKSSPRKATQTQNLQRAENRRSPSGSESSRTPSPAARRPLPATRGGTTNTSSQRPLKQQQKRRQSSSGSRSSSGQAGETTGRLPEKLAGPPSRQQPLGVNARRRRRSSSSLSPSSASSRASRPSSPPRRGTAKAPLKQQADSPARRAPPPVLQQLGRRRSPYRSSRSSSSRSRSSSKTPPATKRRDAAASGRPAGKTNAAVQRKAAVSSLPSAVLPQRQPPGQKRNRSRSSASRSSRSSSSGSSIGRRRGSRTANNSKINRDGADRARPQQQNTNKAAGRRRRSSSGSSSPSPPRQAGPRASRGRRSPLLRRK